MITRRLKVILLASLIAAFVTMPPAHAQQRQRRVFTNEDISRTPPPAPAPAAAPAPPTGTAAAPATRAEGAPDAASTPATPGAATAEAAENLQGVSLVQHLQRVLQRYRSEIGVQQEQEVDSGRVARLNSVLDLITQLIVQNQLFIADLQAQQPPEGEAQPPSQPPSQPAAGSQP